MSSGGSWTSKSTPAMATRTASQSSESSLVRSSHVYTSMGATLEACASVLRRAGASEVCAVAYARALR